MTSDQTISDEEDFGYYIWKKKITQNVPFYLLSAAMTM